MYYGWFGTEPAHRASYRIFRGPIPEGLSVCHTCDIPLCVRPNHLWTGTTKQNMVDAKSKGRLNNKPRPQEGHGDGPFEAALVVAGNKHRLGACRTALQAMEKLDATRPRFGRKPTVATITAYGFPSIIELILDTKATIELSDIGIQITAAHFRRLVATVIANTTAPGAG